MDKSVFISYSSVNYATALEIVNYIEKRGVSCFICQRDVGGGDGYSGILMRAMRECKAAVMVCSTAINGSHHIPREAEVLTNEKKPIVPFYIEDFALNDNIAYYIAPNQRIMAYTGKPSDHYDKLIEALALRGIQFAAPVEEKPAKKREADSHTQKVFNYIPERGIMINPEDQQRNVSFRTDTLIGLLGGIYGDVVSLLDDERAREIFRRSGYSAGQSFANRLNSRWDNSPKSGMELYKEKLRKWCEFDSDVGWGKFDITIDADENTGAFSGRLTINECFIVDVKKKRHICEFVRGYCEGVIETLLGVEVKLTCAVCPMKSIFRTACEFEITLCEQ